jgi:hypothetical protein
MAIHDRHDGFEISNGGFDHWTHNDVAHVCKHHDGLVSHASPGPVAIHASNDERT